LSLRADIQKRDDFLGQTLFHFLGTGADEQLFQIFDSIVRRGLLLTVGNKEGKLDRFSVHMVGGAIESFEVMQHARVCFTDIPEEMLSAHCQEYGMFGLGFSCETILAWGGNPVFYLPNHPTAATLENSMGGMLYNLHRVPLLLSELRSCLAPENPSSTVDYINQAEQSLRRMWGFVKEMSSQKANDYRYLYEREWRIVDGVMLGHEVDSTRELSDDEIRELATKCERWTKPLDMSESMSRRYPHKHMLQFFRFFNGLSRKTVSQAIEVVLVPSDALKRRVLKYIETYPDRFRSPNPVVRVFGAE
jgi:hypothetical protein